MSSAEIAELLMTVAEADLTTLDAEELEGLLEILGNIRFVWNGVIDERSCEYCVEQIMSMRVYGLDDELPEIPAHPHCRCYWEVI